MKSLYLCCICLFIALIPVSAQGIFDVIYELSIPIVEVVTTDGEEPCFTPVYEDHVSIVDNEYVTGSMIMIQNGDTIYKSGEYVKGESGMKIKVRGNTSANIGQTPYKIKLSQKDNLLKYLGEKGSKNKEWILLKSNYRTVVGMSLSRLMEMEWTPRLTFVNVVLNGAYKGFYLLTESVTKDNKRCDISDDGLIIENDAWYKGENIYFQSDVQQLPLYANSVGYTFKYPDDEDIDDLYVEAVASYVKELEEVLTSDCGAVSDMMDLRSFAKWELFHDLLGSRDAGGSNMYLYKDTFIVGSPTGDKLKIGPVWDLDGAFMTDSCWSSIHNTYYFGQDLIDRSLNVVEPFVEIYKEEYERIRSKVVDLVPSLRDSLFGKEADINQCSELNYLLCGVSYFGVFEEVMDLTEKWFSERVQWMDSAVVTMTSMYGEPTMTNMDIVACDSVEVQNRLVKVSGVYYDTLRSHWMCDSVVVTNVRIDYSETTDFAYTVCDSVLWNGRFLYETGFYTDTFSTVTGCDSVVNLTLVVGYTQRDTVYEHSCDSFLWRGHVLTESGLYVDTLVGSNGCDSISYLDLSISYSQYDTVTAVSCDSFFWHDRFYYESGLYTDILTTVEGCDSIVTLDLTVHYSKTTFVDTIACISYQWNEMVYTESGSYVQQFYTTEGCDSVVYLQLIVAKPALTILNDTIDWMQSYHLYGFDVPFEMVAEAKTHEIVRNLFTVYGCDSIVKLYLHVMEEDLLLTSVSLSSMEMCHGDRIQLEYQLMTGSPVSYSLSFDSVAQRQGFKNVERASSYDNISFTIPDNAESRQYYLEFMMEGKEKISNIGRVYFTVGLDSMLLEQSSRDMLYCKDTNQVFSLYQWYKNDELIKGRMGQYCYEEGGLNGTYYCLVLRSDGLLQKVCPRYFYDLIPEFSVIVAPNPIRSGQMVSVTITGIEDDELTKTKAWLCDYDGRVIMQLDMIKRKNILQLMEGSYLLVVERSSGERKVRKIVVE